MSGHNCAVPDRADEPGTAPGWVRPRGPDGAPGSALDPERLLRVCVDGPYLESGEHIGGFWVLDVADEAEAIPWAERATVACEGDVEVREFQGIA